MVTVLLGIQIIRRRLPGVGKGVGKVCSFFGFNLICGIVPQVLLLDFSAESLGFPDILNPFESLQLNL